MGLHACLLLDGVRNTVWVLLYILMRRIAMLRMQLIQRS
jgi:hypothetical protein